MWPTFERPRPRLALVGGLLATVLLAAIVAPLGDHVTRAVPALGLVVPVVATAVIGGRVPAFIVAAFATFGFSFALPPLGSPQVRLSEDVLALVVFSAVAFAVSALVTTRVTALEKVDDQRRAMLRSVSHDLRTPLAAIHAVATDLHAGADYDQRTRDELLDVVIDVRIAARARGDFVEITVADNGPGLPPEIATRVRASALDGGPGLGLAICQAIVTLHGGSLRPVDHQTGTCIAVTIPTVH